MTHVTLSWILSALVGPKKPCTEVFPAAGQISGHLGGGRGALRSPVDSLEPQRIPEWQRKWGTLYTSRYLEGNSGHKYGKVHQQVIDHYKKYDILV